MSNTIQIKRSSTSGSAPTAGQLAQGELAVNLADEALYTKDASNAVVKLNAPSIDDKNTGATKHVTIGASGSVAIGGAPSSRRFSVYLNAATNYAGEFIQQSATGHAIAAVCNSSDTNGRYFDGYSDSAGASRIIIYSNGNVQNTNNSYGALSDLKLKENIVDATPKLDKLNQVRVVNYNLKDTPDQKMLGVVAQELEQIFPGMVEETSDFDREGNDLGTTTKSVKYSVFVPMLIKAMQEQQAIITALTARVEALEAV
jgi:hypothetical protein